MSAKRPSALFWTCAAALLAAAWALFHSTATSGEPVHDGHPLSYWVKRTNYVPLLDLGMHGEGGFRERTAAFDELVAIGGPAVPDLCRILDDPKLKWDRRWQAVGALARIGLPARAAAHSLLGALNDPTFPEANRYELITTLVAIGAAGDCAADLTHYLKQRYIAVPPSDLSGRSTFDQFQAVTALGKAGEPAKIAIPLLIEMLSAYEKLATSSAGAPSTIPADQRAAESAHEIIRFALVATLAGLRPYDPRALPALRQAEHDPSARVREAVARTLSQPPHAA